MQEIICEAVNDFPDFTEILFPLTFHRLSKKYLSGRLNWSSKCLESEQVVNVPTGNQFAALCGHRQEKKFVLDCHTPRH